MATPVRHDQVAEFQGLYGPFVCPERVLQKIWLGRDFDQARAATPGGERIEVLSPGSWNLLGGPDFRSAQLRLAGVPLVGDVEVHFRVGDWRHHGHESNPAFGRVVLHVVLFPPAPGEPPARRADGRALPVLALLPLLWRGLEEHASDDALEHLTARDDWRWLAELGGRPAEELRRLFRERAAQRWGQKRRYARLRLDALGWAAAAHQAALEILGYRRNRAPMLAVAARHPVEAWATGLDVEAVFRDDALAWSLHGLRPANHPRDRLAQYAAWVGARPDWVVRLPAWAAGIPEGPGPGASTLTVRRALGLGELRRRLAGEITGGAVGGPRLDNLAADGFLPLLAEATGRDLFAPWFHWFAGDAPIRVREALRRTGVAGGAGHPVCQGWVQGMLGWMLNCDTLASA